MFWAKQICFPKIIWGNSKHPIEKEKKTNINIKFYYTSYGFKQMLDYFEIDFKRLLI